MGISTVSQLVQRAKSMNEYNNSGVANDSVWVDFFNEALMSLVEDLNILEEVQITINPSLKSYDLPENYYGLIHVTNSLNNELSPYKDYGFSLEGTRSYSPGYDIKNKGFKYVIEFPYIQPETLTVTYIRYPTKLEFSQRESQKPEIPTSGESALCYKAISNALKNNNQLGQAQYYDSLFREQMGIVRTANLRARGQ